MQKNDDLKQIKELLEIVKHKVDRIEVTQVGQSASIYLMRDQLSVMNEKLDGFQKDLGEVKEDLQGVKKTQDRQILPSVTCIETHIKAYKDAYQVNNANGKKLEKRVKVLEKRAGVTPPEELILVGVS